MEQLSIQPTEPWITFTQSSLLTEFLAEVSLVSALPDQGPKVPRDEWWLYSTSAISRLSNYGYFLSFSVFIYNLKQNLLSKGETESAQSGQRILPDECDDLRKRVCALSSKMIINVELVITVAVLLCSSVVVSRCHLITRAPQADGADHRQQGSRFVDAVNEFAVEIYRKLATGDMNVFFCPVCLYSSLALLEEVSGGKTKAELNVTLSMKANKLSSDEVRTRLSELNRRMRHTSCLSRTANGLFIDESCLTAPKSNTTSYEVLYNTGVFGLDFKGNPQQAAWDINEFVRVNTGANIKRVIERTGDFNEVPSPLLLLNAVHFGADIVSSDDRSHDSSNNTNNDGIDDDNSNNNTVSSYGKNRSTTARVKRTFFNHGVGDHDLYVQAIDSRQQKVRIAESYDFRALEVPCLKGITSNVSIWIFLPHKIGRLYDVEFGLSADLFREVEKSFREGVTDISIPRIKFSCDMDLNEDLRDLGVRRAFNSIGADFHGLSDKKGLRLTKVLHRASVDIGEQGPVYDRWTDADDESGDNYNETSRDRNGTSSRSSSINDLPPFNADHPFLFFVMDKPSGLILYIGKLYEF